MSYSSTTPPGWYPDPYAQGGLRWWDGQAWTGHVAAGGAPTPSTGPVLKLDDERASAQRARWGLVIAAISQVLVLPLYAVMISSVVTTFRDAVEHPYVTHSTSTTGGAVSSLTSLVGLGNIVGLILLLLWFHRAVTNGAALGFPGPRSTGIAIASFFIPIVNFWWPYESLRDSVPPFDLEVRRAVKRWWVLWIVSPLGIFPVAVFAAFSLRNALVLALVYAILPVVALGRGFTMLEVVTSAHADAAVRRY